jgi:alpha-beta hydrolase superfamily lysophospholipase
MSKCRFVLLASLAAALVGLRAPRVQAQEKFEKVRITTVDSVELMAQYYPCRDAKTKNAPVIIMLHPIGESSQKKPWLNLAEALSKNFAVITFDFRGHGNSTEVLPETFWQFPANLQGNTKANAANAAGKSTIDIKEFSKGYYPVLCNDIAAVKCFLDRKNDTGACNTSSTILLGAETGATLGAIWLNAEWHRYRVVQNPINPLITTVDPRAEGNDYIAGVWLSISPQLGSNTLSIGRLLDISMRQKAMPTVFLHSNEDTKGKTLANNLIKAFKSPREKNKYPFTDRVEVKAGKLTGMDLVQQSLQTDQAILEYLNGVVDLKGREWAEREFRKTAYVWRMSPVAPPLNAHNANENNLIFDTYVKFAR